MQIEGNTMPEYTTDDYETPWAFVRKLEAVYGEFDLDPCCTPVNAKASNTLYEAGLTAVWKEHGTNAFVNPPYSELGDWVLKMAYEAQMGMQVVGLILSSTDTRYWHECVMGVASEVLFVKGRIAFELGGVPQKNNRYLNAVVMWEPYLTLRETRYGAIDAD